jgi:hypothetical protein
MHSSKAASDMESSLPLPFTSRQAGGFQDERVRVDEYIAKEEENQWAVAQTFFDHRSLVTDHITSYNNFVKEGIHELFREAEPFEVQPPDEVRFAESDSCSKSPLVVSNFLESMYTKWVDNVRLVF